MDYSMDYSNLSSTQYSSGNPVVTLVCSVLIIIGMWLILTKAGEKGWKAIIPFYGTYTLFKIAGRSFWPFLIALLVCSFSLGAMVVGGTVIFLGAAGGSSDIMGGSMIATSIATLLSFISAIFLIVLKAKFDSALSRSFGHGGGFAAGLFFLAPIFYMILGLNQDQYLGPNGQK